MAKRSRQEPAYVTDSHDLLSTVRALSPVEFERWVADILQLHFPTADVQIIGSSGDRGVDVIVTDGNGTLVVQCKRYGPNKPVGSRELQMFLGAMMHRQTARGAFITTSHFTSEARAIGDTHRIWLVDEGELTKLASRYDPVVQEKKRVLLEAEQAAEQAAEEDRHHREYQTWSRNQEKLRQKQEAQAADYRRWQEHKRVEEERKRVEMEAWRQRQRRQEDLEMLWYTFATFFFLWAVTLIGLGLYVSENFKTFGTYPNDLPALLLVTAVVAVIVMQLIIIIFRTR